MKIKKFINISLFIVCLGHRIQNLLLLHQNEKKVYTSSIFLSVESLHCDVIQGGEPACVILLSFFL